MNRVALIIALFIAGGGGVVLGVYSTIDLSIAQFFFEKTIQIGNGLEARRLIFFASLVRLTGIWIEIFLIALPVIALVARLVLPQTRPLLSGRSIVFLIVSFLLGPGLVVNVVLKPHWERPRPGDLVQFGGKHKFVPWWKPGGGCRSNCSFVSGEASSAFWTLAPAALTPPPWRPLSYAVAITFGITVAATRIIMGGHFLSDAIFAGVFTFLIVWFTYAAIYRWPRTRLDNKAIEDAIFGVSVFARAFLSRFGFRRSKSDRKQ